MCILCRRKVSCWIVDSTDVRVQWVMYVTQSYKYSIIIQGEAERAENGAGNVCDSQRAVALDRGKPGNEPVISTTYGVVSFNTRSRE